MQAVVVKGFGGPEVLVAAEVPDPVAGAGEVVVAVAAAHVLWVETRIRSGVTIDLCLDCYGIFLDRGEFERLMGMEAGALGFFGKPMDLPRVLDVCQQAA